MTRLCPRFALTLEFDGTPFMGLQRQPHGPTVQAAVEAAAKRVTGEDVTLHSAGRTDTGVHALAMRSHVDIAKPIEAFRLMEALNALLRPAPIAVTGVRNRARRLARTLQLHRAQLQLPHRQPPRAAYARRQPRLAGGPTA